MLPSFDCPQALVEHLGSSALCVAIGFFDGMHIGHQEVIRNCLGLAKRKNANAAVVTFRDHPLQTVAPDKAPDLVHDVEARLAAFEQLGLKAALFLPFDASFRTKSAHEFFDYLRLGLDPLIGFSIGSGFGFGRGRTGNSSLLKALGSPYNIETQVAKEINLDGLPVSSTRIRTAIRKGEFKTAGKMLGRPYQYSETVIEGDKRGRGLGFPTANLPVNDRVYPENGVYMAWAYSDNHRYPAAVNIGVRPTLKDEPRVPVMEVHLLDFNEDLYGKRLDVEFVMRIRPETRFDSLDALKEQVQKDVAFTRDKLVEAAFS